MRGSITVLGWAAMALGFLLLVPSVVLAAGENPVGGCVWAVGSVVMILLGFFARRPPSPTIDRPESERAGACPPIARALTWQWAVAVLVAGTAVILAYHLGARGSGAEDEPEVEALAPVPNLGEPESWCGALREMGMDAGAWRPFAEGVEEWWCVSDELPIGQAHSLLGIPTHLQYSVRGQPEKADEVRLILDVFEASTADEGRERMIEALNTLASQGLLEIPEELPGAIEDARPTVLESGSHRLTLLEQHGRQGVWWLTLIVEPEEAARPTELYVTKALLRSLDRAGEGREAVSAGADLETAQLDSGACEAARASAVRRVRELRDGLARCVATLNQSRQEDSRTARAPAPAPRTREIAAVRTLAAPRVSIVGDQAVVSARLYNPAAQDQEVTIEIALLSNGQVVDEAFQRALVPAHGDLAVSAQLRARGAEGATYSGRIRVVR